MSRSTRTGGREATKGVIPGRIALSVGRPELPEPAGFSWCPLSDLARLESGHTPSRSRDSYWGGEVPWIGIRDATANHGKVIDKTLDRVTQEGLDNSSARLLPAGTVCLSRTASVGFVVEMGRPMATSQDFVNWVCGPQLNSSYLRYLLMLEQASIRRFAHGTTHQTMYYPEAKALNVLVPTRRQQDAIADVLCALDDKVAANERIIELAAELDLLQALRASGSPVSYARLDSIATVTKGVSYRSVDLVESPNALVTLKSIDRRGAFNFGGFKPYAGDYKPAQVLIEDDIIVAQTDLTQKAEVVGRAARVPRIEKFNNLIASLDLAVVRSNAHVPQQYLLGILRQATFRKHCLSRTSGTTVLHLGRGAVESYECPLASDDAMAAYAAASATRLHLADALRFANSRLVETRDELLPLLMSGRIRVRDAERQAEDVL